MYKLLLVTDREEVKAAFENVSDLADMMFAPLTIISRIDAAIEYLERNPVDSVGYSIRFSDVGPLHQYLVEKRPSLPIFQTHYRDERLHEELRRISRFLDTLHADYSDEDYDEAAVLEYLRDELIHQLLARQIGDQEELKSRFKLLRAHLSWDKPCFLFDFDLPQGEVYLSDRWHYGRERLESALRNNFFGRYIDNIFYGVAVLTTRHIRLIAAQRQDSPDADAVELGYQVQHHVQDRVAQIKEYLDLDLNLEQYTVLPSIMDLAGQGPQA